MLFPPYKSSNRHTVSLIGRLFFYVTSASRKDLVHVVDLEGFEKWPTICDCESFRYHERPCRHIVAAIEAISAWAGIAEEHRDEFIERLSFLLSLDHGFREAMESAAIKELMPAPPEIRRSRQYTITMDRNKPGQFATK